MSRGLAATLPDTVRDGRRHCEDGGPRKNRADGRHLSVSRPLDPLISEQESHADPEARPDGGTYRVVEQIAAVGHPAAGCQRGGHDANAGHETADDEDGGAE